jgi:hypothetical protein
MRLFQFGLAAGLLAAAPAFAQAPEGASVTRTQTATAIVESIDRTPQQREMIEFARSLRPGQQVDIVYGRAVALRVEPMRR